MDDVMGLSVGSFAEDEACSWVKSTVRQWRDDHAGVLELVRYLGCLPLAVSRSAILRSAESAASPSPDSWIFPRDSITTAWRLSGQSSLLNNARFGARTLMLPPSLSSTAQR